MAEQFFEEILKESMSENDINEADYKKKLYEKFQVSAKIYFNFFLGYVLREIYDIKLFMDAIVGNLK